MPVGIEVMQEIFGGAEKMLRGWDSNTLPEKNTRKRTCCPAIQPEVA
jgi:hypothetical protein